MKKTLKITGAIVGLLAAAVGCFLLFVIVRGVPTYEVPQPKVAPIVATAERVAHGEKLVLSACASCHLNRKTNTLSGQRLADVPPEFGRLYASNITQDKVRGIGNWTDQELVGLLRTGIGFDGRYRLIMPNFVHMSDEDVASIVAYLRSASPLVQADATPSHPQEPSLLSKVLVNTVMKPAPLPKKQVLAPSPANAVAFGRYLVVGRYRCYNCHSQSLIKNNELEPEASAGYLGGGSRLLNQNGQPVVSPNLTDDAETGIGNWTEAEFAQAVRFGNSPHGPLQYPMPKYSQLSDEEIRALYAYLKTVPVISNPAASKGSATAMR